MCERVPIYREQWEAAFGGDLECQCECGNAADAYAVSVVREGSHDWPLNLMYACFL